MHKAKNIYFLLIKKKTRRPKAGGGLRQRIPASKSEIDSRDYTIPFALASLSHMHAYAARYGTCILHYRSTNMVRE